MIFLVYIYIRFALKRIHTYISIYNAQYIYKTSARKQLTIYFYIQAILFTCDFSVDVLIKLALFFGIDFVNITKNGRQSIA